MATILCVDDSTLMREMVSFALQEAGFEVKTCCDGEEALSVAKLSSFAMVITDLNMPKLDGVKLIESLRRLEKYKFTPILMLTTEASAERKLAGKQAGATGWIVKPFQPEQLVGIAQKLLR
jgi:two-component system, chemotaxis family, chemotaxis protein CheY